MRVAGLATRAAKWLAAAAPELLGRGGGCRAAPAAAWACWAVQELPSQAAAQPGPLSSAQLRYSAPAGDACARRAARRHSKSA
jgi:hypothetical protein